MQATPAAAEQRQAALQTYEGSFLTSLLIDDAPDFMAWVVAQRAHWDACFDRLAEQEMRRLSDEGRAEEASLLGQTWVARRPDTDAAFRLLATTQATAGDVAGAQVTLATAARRWAELGLDLPAETQALRAELGQLAALPVVTPQPLPQRVLRLPFVGRLEALAQLRRAFQQAQGGIPAGAAGAALVVGEAGVGKTRLLRTFARWARVQGADVALGRADELSGRLPYQPLMELLRERLARERAPDDLLEDSWLIELQRLVPDLHDRYPDLPPPVDDAAAGARLLEAVAQLGLALAGRQRPLLWLLDDLQWADAATRDGLLYLLKRWRDAQAPVLIVCTVRSEDLAAEPALQDWIAGAQRTTAPTTVSEIPLAPLSAEMTREAVTTLLAASASAEVCAWLYDTTQGNPLYVTRVLQALVERGAVRWQVGRAGDRGDTPRLAPDVEVAALAGWLPDTLRGVLLRSVRQLDPVAQQTLAAAAVVGTRFDEGLLVPVAGVEEEAVLAGLELAERRLLIRAEAGAYRFAHDKVAEAVYSDLSLARRRVFHRRALRALETAGDTSGAASAAAELARHALGAEDWEAAMRYSQRAAEAAAQLGAHRDAVRQYEQVVRLLTTTPSREALRPPRFSDEARADLYSRLGLLYANLGERDRARALHEALLAEARSRGARVLEGRALFEQGRFAHVFERDAAAGQRLLEEARQIAQEQGDVLGLLQSERGLASVAKEQGDFALSEAYLQRVVELARASGLPRSLAQGLDSLSDVFKLRGDWEAACATCEESLMLWADLTDTNTTTMTNQGTDRGTDRGSTTPTSVHFPPPHPFTPDLAWAAFVPRIAPLARPQPTSSNHVARQWGANDLMGMGNARLHLGEGATGRAAMRMGWQIFTELNGSRFHHFYLLHWTLGWTEAGEYERALREARQVLEAMTTAIERPLDATDVRPQCALVDAHHALFQLAEAREPLERAVAFAPGKPIWERVLPATRRCTQHALAGEWLAAAAAARAAQEVRETMPSPLTWFDFARYYETEALLRAGDRTRAQVDVRRLGAHLGANRRYRLVYLRMQALLDRDAGDHTAAIAHLLEALDLARQMGLPGEEWQIAAELAASYAGVDDTKHVAEARRRAEGVIASLAARISDPALRDHFTQAALSRRPALG
jgi:tetratricopeptide (TPR) repeat protein